MYLSIYLSIYLCVVCVCVHACAAYMHATANEYNKSVTNVALHCLPNDIDAVGAAEVNQEAWKFQPLTLYGTDVDPRARSQMLRKCSKLGDQKWLVCFKKSVKKLCYVIPGLVLGSCVQVPAAAG